MDGVLLVSGEPIQGAPDAVRRLRANGHRLRFVTNTTTRSRAQLAEALRSHGIEVEDYGSTAEFASRYRKPQCGCLIIDQHLPVLTGVDFLNSPAGKGLDIPVILITGRSDPSLEERAREAGVAEYLQKPLGERVLLATVARLTAER